MDRSRAVVALRSLLANRLALAIMLAGAVGFGIIGPIASSHARAHSSPIDADPATLLLHDSDLGADFEENWSKSGPDWPPCGSDAAVEAGRVAAFGVMFNAPNRDGVITSMAYEYVDEAAASRASAALGDKVSRGIDVTQCLVNIRYGAQLIEVANPSCVPADGRLFVIGARRQVLVWRNHNVVDLLDVDLPSEVDITVLSAKQDAWAPFKPVRQPCSRTG